MTRGYFGIGVFHAKKAENIGTLFRSAMMFGADFMFTVGRRYTRQPSDTPKAWRHVPVHHYEDLADLMAHLPMDAPLVGIEQDATAVALPAFTHPQRAVYLLGAEDHGLTPEAIARCHRLVEIPGTARCLNVASAGSIVLYDRIAKRDLAQWSAA